MSYRVVPLLFTFALASCAPGTSTPPSAALTTTPATSLATPEAPPLCGNNELDDGETCDDGNTLAGDGCSPRCRREPVAFSDGTFWTLSDETVVKWRPWLHYPPETLSIKAKISQSGGIVFDWENYVSPSDSHLPDELMSRVVSLEGDRTSACVAIDSGEIWCTAPSNSYTDCSLKQTLDSGLWYTARNYGKYLWCRVERPAGPVIALSDDCAVESDERLFCWSDPQDQRPLGDRRLAGFSAGGGVACALSVEGEVGCWGEADTGELGYMGEHWFNEGDEETPDEEGFRHDTPPTQFMRFPSKAKAIDASGGLPCALLENHDVWCWGSVDIRFEGKGIEAYQARLMAPESTPQNPVYKKPGESTLPSAPIALPPDCNPEAFSYPCALCSPGCWKCLDRETEPKDEQCIQF